MKMYNSLQLSKALGKSYPTIKSWEKQNRILASANAGRMKLYTQQKFEEIKAELEVNDRPSIKKKVEEDNTAMFAVST